MGRSRDIRRALRDRAVHHARYILRYVWGYDENDGTWASEFAKKSADNLKMCSQSCCGNPRRHFGLKTRQEERSLMDYEEWLKEALSE